MHWRASPARDGTGLATVADEVQFLVEHSESHYYEFAEPAQHRHLQTNMELRVNCTCNFSCKFIVEARINAE